MTFKRKTSEGSVLVISLVVLGVIALASIYLSLTLLQEIRSTRFADNAIVGYYVSESGAEDALWRLKYARTSGGASFFDDRLGTTLCAAETGNENQSGVTDPEVNCVGSSPPSDSDPERFFDYQTLSIAADKFTAYDIERNSPVIADLYDPIDEEDGDTSINTGVQQLDINWYFEECTGLAGSAKLETTLTPISYQGGVLTPGTPVTEIDPACACDPNEPDPTTGFFKCEPNSASGFSAQYPVSPTSFYRVTFRSLDQPFKKLEVFAFDGSSSTDFPSQVEVEVNGRYRESQSQVRLRAAWRDALSGIFNYVVFSEDSLIKDTQTDNSSAFTSLCGFCNDVSNSACSSTTDCPGASTCSIENTAIDAVDGSDTAAFCTLDHDPSGSGEDDGSGASSSGEINQTNLGACNLSCNGITYCGDGTIQLPNGAGSGGYDTTPGTYPGTGYEECDDGTANSDTIADRCRTSCRDPYCGDGVADTGEGCDDGNTYNGDECDTDNSNGYGQCTPTFCGDGVPQCFNGANECEICDQGALNGTGSGFCLSDCSGIEP